MIRGSLPELAAAPLDVLVVGGGIYGVATLLSATQRGLRAGLVESADFGSGTSWNSLRILHGGLRYLQSADLPRFIQSVRERRRFARCFPQLVEPLTCVMPLYGEGMRRPAALRAALFANDILSGHRNAAVTPGLELPRGRVVDAAAVRSTCGLIRTAGLQGGARWTDYRMISSERVLIEMLHWACEEGALAVNYARAVELLTDSGRQVAGVSVQDQLGGGGHEIRARAVINCAGPWARDLAAGWHNEPAELFHPSLAFNLLLDLPLPSGAALAVAAPGGKSPMYFLVPQGATTMVGTAHFASPPQTTDAVPGAQEIATFLRGVDAALPGWGATPSRVRRVFAGLLPAATVGTAQLSKRETIVDHGKQGGAEGLFSVAGVKFTTSRDVADRAIDAAARLFGQRKLGLPEDEQRDCVDGTSWLVRHATVRDAAPGAVAACLARCASDEAVRQDDDLFLRRTNWVAAGADMESLRHSYGTDRNQKEVV